jgi:hypothetical protein
MPTSLATSSILKLSSNLLFLSFSPISNLLSTAIVYKKAKLMSIMFNVIFYTREVTNETGHLGLRRQAGKQMLYIYIIVSQNSNMACLCSNRKASGEVLRTKHKERLPEGS